MSKPVIAVDIDDVLAVSVPEFIAYSNEKWGTKLTIDDYDEHWARMWNVDYDEVTRRAREFHATGVASRYRRTDGAEQVLADLARRYKLVITTSRRIELEKYTYEWIEMHFKGVFEEIHFAGMWDKISDDSHLATKAELCQQIGADFLIDDQLKHCIAAAEIGLVGLLFGDYPWNKAEASAEGVVRVKDWHAVKEYFDGRG